MALSLDAEVEALALELARLRGVSPAEAVRDAVRDDLDRVRRERKASEDATPGGLTRELAEQIFGY